MKKQLLPGNAVGKYPHIQRYSLLEKFLLVVSALLTLVASVLTSLPVVGESLFR